MRFSIVITAAPETDAASSAVKFCLATLQQKHEVYRLFFLAEGARNLASDSFLCSQWKDLIQNENLDAVCCISSAKKYGLIDTTNLDQLEIAAHWQFGGLGQLIDAEIKSDRLITFG